MSAGAEALPAFSIQQTVVAAALCVAGAGYAGWFRQRRAALGLLLLAWLALGFGGRTLAARYGWQPALDPAAVAAAWLPWNLLLIAAAPRWRAPVWLALAWPLLFAGEFAVAFQFGLDPAWLGRWLADVVPAPLGAWLSPLEPALLAITALVLFGRWQVQEESAELTLCLTCSLMLLAALRPEWTLGALLAGAGLLLGGAFHATYRMAFVDPLTGLANRRALDAALAAGGRGLAIAMLDIDHFKQINDRYGHDFGDQVLRMVAARIRGRRRGRPFRYGGEEFCVLLRTSKRAVARRWCEEIRSEVGARPIVPRGPQRPPRRPLNKRRYRRAAPQLTVTVSIGVALQGGRLADAAMVLEAADKALYRAKRAGRDRVVVARN